MNTNPAQQRKPDPLFEAQGGVRMSNMGTFQQAETADIYYRAMLAKAKLKMRPVKWLTANVPAIMPLTSVGL